MVIQMTSRMIKGKEATQKAIVENFRGLYRKDSQFTYPEATLILPKNNKKKK